MDGLKRGKLGGVLDHSCPSSGLIYLLALRSDTLLIYLFISFFVQKVMVALEEAVVLVGKINPIRYY
jgi:hypothetical protein